MSSNKASKPSPMLLILLLRPYSNKIEGFILQRYQQMIKGNQNILCFNLWINSYQEYVQYLFEPILSIELYKFLSRDKQMGNQCFCDTTSGNGLLEQPHLTKQLSCLLSGKERQQYNRQLATLQLKEAVNLYDQFYLNRISFTSLKSSKTRFSESTQEPSFLQVKNGTLSILDKSHEDNYKGVYRNSNLLVSERMKQHLRLSKITEQQFDYSRASQFQQSFRASYLQDDQIPQTQSYEPINDELIISKQALAQKASKEQYQKIGLDAIKKNQVAVILMSGKQGFNLDFSQPLGTYDIGLDSTYSILGILLKRLSKLTDLASGYKGQSGLFAPQKIKVYIMTNAQNKQELKSFMKKHNYMGYGSQNIYFFSQISVPVMDLNGKVMLKSQSQIMTSPLGNGMIFSEMSHKRIFEHIGRQVKYVYMGSVDNLLMKIADPIMLGYMIKQKKEMICNCVNRNKLTQKIPKRGINFGYIGIESTPVSKTDKFKYKIYEHMKTPPAQAKWINTGSCFITLNAIKHTSKSQKFASYCSKNRQVIVKERMCFFPDNQTFRSELCLFFQLYYHQILHFQLNSSVSIIEVDPKLEFSPIKKKLGIFSFESARVALRNLHKQWALQSGYSLDESGYLQLDPRLTYNGQNLQKVFQKYADRNRHISLPKYIC